MDLVGGGFSLPARIFLSVQPASHNLQTTCIQPCSTHATFIRIQATFRLTSRNLPTQPCSNHPPCCFFRKKLCTMFTQPCSTQPSALLRTTCTPSPVQITHPAAFFRKNLCTMLTQPCSTQPSALLHTTYTRSPVQTTHPAAFVRKNLCTMLTQPCSTQPSALLHTTCTPSPVQTTHPATPFRKGEGACKEEERKRRAYKMEERREGAGGSMNMNVGSVNMGV